MDMEATAIQLEESSISALESHDSRHQQQSNRKPQPEGKCRNSPNPNYKPNSSRSSSRSPGLKRLSTRRNARRTPSNPSSGVTRSSDSVQGLGLRLRRASVVAKRGGPSTPAPSWKVYNSLSADSMGEQEHLPSQVRSVSARKLAASLWEMEGVPALMNTEDKKALSLYFVTGNSQIENDRPRQQQKRKTENSEDYKRYSFVEKQGKHQLSYGYKPANMQHHQIETGAWKMEEGRQNSYGNKLPHRKENSQVASGSSGREDDHRKHSSVDKPRHHQTDERQYPDGETIQSHQQNNCGDTCQHLQSHNHKSFGQDDIQEHRHHFEAENLQPSGDIKVSLLNAQKLSPAASQTDKDRRQQKTGDGNVENEQTHSHNDSLQPKPAAPMAEVDADHLAVVSTLTSQSELLQLINHVCRLEKKHASSMSLVGALQQQLDQTRSQLQEVCLNKQTHLKEIDSMNKRMLKERIMWREQQEEIIQAAVHSVRNELDYERKSKERLESLHKRLAHDLKDVKKSLSKALQELQRERKARELVEEVCDELARKVNEDNQRFEQIKYEYARIREEVEEERRMLQVAEMWREERVQMKLMEAKLELEEKNEALDRLRSEMEACLKSRIAIPMKEECIPTDPPRHSLDGRMAADYLHQNSYRGLISARKSVDSACGFQVLRSNAWRAGIKEGFANSHYDLQSMQNESTSKYSIGQETQNSFQQNAAEKKGKASKKLISGRSNGLSWLLNKKNDFVRREAKEYRDETLDQLQSTQWTTNKIDGEKVSLQHSENNPGNSGPVLSGDNVHTRTVLNPVLQHSERESCPTRQWRHCELVTEPGSIRSDNSLKAKLLEAKLEDEHSQLKTEKGS